MSQRAPHVPVVAGFAAAALTLTPLALSVTTDTAAAAAAAAQAPGAPGDMSHFDLARKDCVGTAAGRSSKVWYTVAVGVLSDVYEPTIHTPNVETMQFVVTDGHNFTDLQTRDAHYRAKADRSGMRCTVVTTADSGRLRLRTTFLTDPVRDTVFVGTRLVGLHG